MWLSSHCGLASIRRDYDGVGDDSWLGIRCEPTRLARAYQVAYKTLISLGVDMVLGIYFSLSIDKDQEPVFRIFFHFQPSLSSLHRRLRQCLYIDELRAITYMRLGPRTEDAREWTYSVRKECPLGKKWIRSHHPPIQNMVQFFKSRSRVFLWDILTAHRLERGWEILWSIWIAVPATET